MGERVPQHIQNQVIRNYCIQNNFQYLLSAVEYSMDDSFLILNQIIKQNKDVNGVGFYSMFQLPQNDIYRMSLLKNIIKKKKFLFFCCEDLMVKNYISLLMKLESSTLTTYEFDERFKAKYGNSDVALSIAIEKIEEILDTPQEETNLKITYSNNQ